MSLMRHRVLGRGLGNADGEILWGRPTSAVVGAHCVLQRDRIVPSGPLDPGFVSK